MADRQLTVEEIRQRLGLKTAPADPLPVSAFPAGAARAGNILAETVPAGNIPAADAPAEGSAREKTQVQDVDRSFYDFRYEEKDVFRVEEGLTSAIVEQISREKHDPDWMREFRLRSLEIYHRLSMPD